MPPDLHQDVPRETKSRLSEFEALVLKECRAQNLIAASTVDAIASRHTADSLQLLRFIPPAAESLADIGSGAGFPGVVFAIATRLHVTLLEPRTLRAAFLKTAVEHLRLDNATVTASRVESLSGKFDVITARAVATLDRLFAMAHHLAHAETVWLLPKGRNVHAELAEARRSWQGELEVQPSLTDAEAGIVVARHVRRRQAT